MSNYSVDDDHKSRNWAKYGSFAILVALILGAGYLFTQTLKVAQPNIPAASGNISLASNNNSSTDNTLYIDLACPDCKNFMASQSKTINEKIKDHKLQVHVIAHLDSPVGSHNNGYSSKSTNAVYCIAQAKNDDSWWKFLTIIFEQQPAEGDDPGSQWLIDRAHEVGVTTADSCIANQTFDKFVQQNTNEAHNSGITWVPTFNGTKQTGVEQLSFK